MRQLFGDRQDLPIAGPSFRTKDRAKPEKRFCTFWKKKNLFGKGLLEKRK
jgi:hypothetical protein